MNRRGRGRGRGRGRSRRAAASVRRGRRRRRVRKASSRMTVTETGCRSRPPTGVARDSGAASSRWASSRFFRGSSAGLGVGRARGWVSDRLRCGDPGATRRARVMRTRWRVRASPSHASARRTCGRRRRRAGLGRVAQAKDRASARERGRRGAYRAGWTSSRRARGIGTRRRRGRARRRARLARPRDPSTRSPRETSSGAASGWWNCRARSRARPRSRGRVAASPATTSCEKSKSEAHHSARRATHDVDIASSTPHTAVSLQSARIRACANLRARLGCVAPRRDTACERCWHPRSDRDRRIVVVGAANQTVITAGQCVFRTHSCRLRV